MDRNNRINSGISPKESVSGPRSLRVINDTGEDFVANLYRATSGLDIEDVEFSASAESENSENAIGTPLQHRASEGESSIQTEMLTSGERASEEISGEDWLTFHHPYVVQGRQELNREFRINSADREENDNFINLAPIPENAPIHEENSVIANEANMSIDSEESSCFGCLGWFF